MKSMLLFTLMLLLTSCGDLPDEKADSKPFSGALEPESIEAKTLLSTSWCEHYFDNGARYIKYHFQAKGPLEMSLGQRTGSRSSARYRMPDEKAGFRWRLSKRNLIIAQGANTQTYRLLDITSSSNNYIATLRATANKTVEWFSCQ